MQSSNSAQRHVLPLAAGSVVCVIAVVVGVMLVKRDKTPVSPEQPTADVVAPFDENEPQPDAVSVPAVTKISPAESQFAWVGLKDEGDVVLICSGVLLGERQCLTCGFVGNYSSASLKKQGLAGSRLVVGVPDEKNVGQWRLIDVLDDITSIPAGSPEIALLSLKEGVTSQLGERYPAADSTTWEKEFSTLGVNKTQLACWGFAIPPNAATLSPNSAPKFCETDITAKEFGTSRFQVEGKPSLNLIRITNSPNSTPGMIAFSKDGRLLGMLTKDTLIPVDRLLFGFPQESRGLIQQ